jgi:hypothetical protein
MMVRNGKIYISRTNMNRIFHRTRPIWDVLREEGLEIVEEFGVVDGKRVGQRVPRGRAPASRVIGIDILETRQRFLTDWRHKFITSNPVTGEPFTVKQLVIHGLPPILVETAEMKDARCERTKR